MGFFFLKVKCKTSVIFPLNLARRWAYAYSWQYCYSHRMWWYYILNYPKIYKTPVPKAQSFHSLCSYLSLYIPMLTLNWLNDRCWFISFIPLPGKSAIPFIFPVYFHLWTFNLKFVFFLSWFIISFQLQNSVSFCFLP